jgi:MarR family 2-MHQ and catechol resistance regulon transcriptional repressor
MPDPAAFEDPRLTTMGLLIETHAGLLRMMGPQLAHHGLTIAEFEVLLRLSRTPGGRLRMTDLAAQVGLSTSGLTRLVDRLERDGLAEREACPTDRRGAFTVVTPAGRTRAQAALAGHVELIDRWFTGLLEAEELRILQGALRKARDAVHPGATAGATAAAGATA